METARCECVHAAGGCLTARCSCCCPQAYEDATGKTAGANKEAFRAAMVRGHLPALTKLCCSGRAVCGT